MLKSRLINRVNPLFIQGICHRGLHNEVDCENSLKAFQNALDVHMAIEFDVHLTKDGELVVFHDSKMERMTGSEGIIEHLTLKEIRENYRLLDGQKIPTFQEVLNLVGEQVPMVVEMKVYELNYKPLAKAVYRMLRKNIRDKSNVMLISFDPRALLPFNGKGYVRQLLIADSASYMVVCRRFFQSIDVDQFLFKDFRVKNYAKHHFVNTWTIETPEQLEAVLPYADTITFQHVDPNLVREKLTKKNAEHLERFRRRQQMLDDFFEWQAKLSKKDNVHDN
ncbi:MAG: hypothetical protein K6F92_06365 [Lachnospiraceae bacterium]|nr:hypothetical protein [Lachnospiraceae bacterium]